MVQIHVYRLAEMWILISLLLHLSEYPAGKILGLFYVSILH